MELANAELEVGLPLDNISSVIEIIVLCQADIFDNIDETIDNFSSEITEDM